MAEHVVAKTHEVQEGERIVAAIGGTEICVFNIDGEYFACTDWCPHQGGPISTGSITGTTDAAFDRESLDTDLNWIKDGKILMCPWHGWEFDITTGESTHDESRLITHRVKVEDGEIVVVL